MEGTIPSAKDRTRMRSKAERRRIVEETFQPGTSVSLVARAHNVNANQVFHWRRLYRAGQLEEEPANTAPLVRVKISNGGNRPVITGKATKGNATASGAIHIDFGYARVRIEGKADPECVRAAMEGLRR
jgi:transposase